MRRVDVPTRDGHSIVLTRIGPPRGAAVALTHGTFSSASSCERLGRFLAAQGFGVWLFDWRGHGLNPSASHDYDLETVAEQDIDGALQEILRQEQGRPITFIGHSGGGIAAAIWAARQPERAHAHLTGLVLLAAQATHAAGTLSARIAIHGYRAWIRRRQWLAASSMVGPERESARLMRQWCQWNLGRSLLGHDGTDYLGSLAQVRIPVLALAGSADRVIAPWQGCKALARAFGGPDVEFHLCGKAAGYVEDYSHSRLLMAGNAQSDVFPRIAQWIRVRSERAQ
ncbi:alpha/beta fold hydrolase [Comamonas sp.]|uniref:alpha/beta fold hydrolase n=1 Tax=Comamonas sp. TaxID=34028 RepID=UPI0012D1CD48|nr:alpha/beta fold hydrolase [Comamonas sp.]MPS92270.1 alpha/beta fold hydrolase [Comamonas sp.]